MLCSFSPEIGFEHLQFPKWLLSKMPQFNDSYRLLCTMVSFRKINFCWQRLVKKKMSYTLCPVHSEFTFITCSFCQQKNKKSNSQIDLVNSPSNRTAPVRQRTIHRGCFKKPLLNSVRSALHWPYHSAKEVSMNIYTTLHSVHLFLAHNMIGGKTSRRHFLLRSAKNTLLLRYEYI